MQNCEEPKNCLVSITVLDLLIYYLFSINSKRRLPFGEGCVQARLHP